jgi:predicted nucleotidyltransferase
MEIEEVKKEIVKIIDEELKGLDFTAFFFGSRVTGVHSHTSDIDVGITSPEPKKPVPERVLRSIKIRCEGIPTLYTIDVVDFSTVSDEFRKVALQKIEKFL